MKLFKRILLLFFIFIFLLKIFVFADDDLLLENPDNLEYYEVSNYNTEEPITYSKNIIVIDRKTHSILYEKDPYTKVPMASTTKIMTCIIALENSNINKEVTISQNAASVSGSTLGLKKNMKISMNDLLYGLMLRSGNDCAIAIAEDISGSVEKFAEKMNEKAKLLGLENTHFVTPHGLDDKNHYTTAYDLALLTDYALKIPKFKEIVSTKEYTIWFNNYPKKLFNTNELLGNLDGVYGVKTGFTFDAGRCLVTSCKRNDLDIIVVVLGADTKNIRTRDSSNLINYIFENYKYINIYNTILESFENYLSYFKNNFSLEKTTVYPVLQLGNLENYEFPLKFNGSIKLSTKIYTLTNFSPKLSPEAKVGNLYLYNNENLLCTVDIILQNKLTPNSWKYYFKNILLLYR